MIIEECSGSKASDFDTAHERRLKSLGVERVAILIQRTNKSLLIGDYRGQRLSILIHRTNESMIVEEFRVSAGSDSDTAHERKHDC